MALGVINGVSNTVTILSAHTPCLGLDASSQLQLQCLVCLHVAYHASYHGGHTRSLSETVITQIKCLLSVSCLGHSFSSQEHKCNSDRSWLQSWCYCCNLPNHAAFQGMQQTMEVWIREVVESCKWGFSSHCSGNLDDNYVEITVNYGGPA